MPADLNHADCKEFLEKLSDNSIEALLTDPPAGIGFMGKEWDHHKGGRDEWIGWLTAIMRQCLRVLKPGAHGLVWAIPRTSHWTATALENAGFEVRDVVMHLFGTGFPKSLDISKAIDKMEGATREVVGENPNHRTLKPVQTMCGAPHSGDGSLTTPDAKQWQGWGTALKPAAEHWILIRKPLSEPTVAKNVIKYGTGGLNIDACRIPGVKASGVMADFKATRKDTKGFGFHGESVKSGITNDVNQGRFPANLVLDEEAAQALDEQSGTLKSGQLKAGHRQGKSEMNGGGGEIARDYGGDKGGASRFFYVAKAAKSEKNAGLEDHEEQVVDDGRQKPIDNPYLRGKTGRKNTHPTVKSITLMRYFARLITPPNGTVLDPFMGSGSTGIAALEEGFKFIGVEREVEYFEIAKKRIDGVARQDRES